MHEGVPIRWLFTSTKTGEILKKRSMDDKLFLLESFVRGALADSSNVEGYVATLWPASGSAPRVITRPEFEDAIKNMSTSLSGIAAMQVRGRRRRWILRVLCWPFRSLVARGITPLPRPCSATCTPVVVTAPFT